MCVGVLMIRMYVEDVCRWAMMKVETQVKRLMMMRMCVCVDVLLMYVVMNEVNCRSTG